MPRPKDKGTGASQPVPTLDHIAEELRPLARPIDELSLDTRNPKKHDRRSIDGLKDSLKRFGQVQLIAVNADGVVMAGNGRLKAARELGWTHIAAVKLTGTAIDARMFAIADNRTAELGTVDHAQLADLMRELDESGADLDGLGFSATEVDALVDLDDGPSDTPERESPEDALEALEAETPKREQAAPKAGKVPHSKQSRLEADPWRMLGFTPKQRKDAEATMALLRKEKDQPDMTIATALTTLCRRYLREHQS